VSDLVIKGDGNIGVNTTDTKTKLHVLNTDDSSGTGDAYISGRVKKPTECLRLQGQWYFTGSGALLRFTNKHGGGLNLNTGEYYTAGVAGFDDQNAWGGVLALYTSPNTSGGGDLTERMIINSAGHAEILGDRAFDGSTVLKLQNKASQYGRTQIHLIGRYENSNDAWSAGCARNAVMFKYQTDYYSGINHAWTIQSVPNGSNNELGFLSGSNDTPRVLFQGSTGRVAIGTNSPDCPLHVASSTSISLNSLFAEYSSSSGSPHIWIPDYGYLPIRDISIKQGKLFMFWFVDLEAGSIS